MAEIFVCGHGGWNVMGANGFVNLPKFTEILLYKEIGEALYVSEAMDILSGARNALQPSRIIRAYENCPDMTLYPATEHWNSFGSAAKKGGVEWLAVGSETRLSDLVTRWHSRIHWIACSVRELKKAPAR